MTLTRKLAAGLAWMVVALATAAPNVLVQGAEGPETDGSKTGKPTYAQDVASILQAKCQTCHRPNQAAPFSLLTYEHAKRWSASIAEVVDEGRMPPWHAAPGPYQFSNDRSLTADQKATLLSWVEAGCPPGDLSQAPPAREFESEWKIGKPDVVLQMAKEYDVKANGILPYQWVKIPTNFTEDKWIQAAEVRPGDRQVVHHVLAFVMPPETERPRDGLNTRNQLCGYAPGDVPAIFPAGTAKKIPAGSDVWLQMHYTPIGKPTKDRTSIGFVFAKEPVKSQVGTHGIFQTRFVIPPGESNHPVEKTFTVPMDVKLLNLWPHMHLRGKDFKFTIKYPDGKSEVLLDVPHYDFAWQTTYNLKSPMKLPKGTQILCQAHFDNSADNKANPNPKQTVHWGDQTYDEMMIGYLDYVVDGPNPLNLESMRRPAADRDRNPNAQAAPNRGNGAAADILRRILQNRRDRQNNPNSNSNSKPKSDPTPSNR